MNRIKAITIGVALAFLLLIGAFIMVTFWRNPLDKMDQGRVSILDKYVGEDMDSILARFGSPTATWDGHYGNRSAQFIQDHSGAKTLRYGSAHGTLYISFEQVDEHWVCFSSCWLPNGCDI